MKLRDREGDIICLSFFSCGRKFGRKNAIIIFITRFKAWLVSKPLSELIFVLNLTHLKEYRWKSANY